MVDTVQTELRALGAACALAMTAFGYNLDPRHALAQFRELRQNGMKLRQHGRVILDQSAENSLGKSRGTK